MKTYPICLIGLEQRRALVIGGGTVALRKTEALLQAGARVTVISPELLPELAALAAQGQIEPVERAYQSGDLAGASLAIAATDDPTVNRAVWQEAEETGCLVNVVDDPAHSNFVMPAVVRRGEVTVSISTGGASPALARRLREKLERVIGPEYGELAAWLAVLRPTLAPGEEREAALDAMLAALPRTDLNKPGHGEKTGGFVSLVGGGPGDPGLITVRGAECLRQADVVVYDRLVNPALLAYAPDAELIDVGKEPDNHPVPQARINELLVTHAQSGKRVVRLKGGDPFVFGRGGEEALALSEAAIPFEIVPGISSAVAAPAYAGIPVTHRNVAGSMAIITGHRANAADTLPAVHADTLVFLMGVQNLPAIVDELIAHGRESTTPAAVIEQGTWPAQRVVTGVLSDIAARADAADIHPPTVIVIGDVVRLRESLRWFD